MTEIDDAGFRQMREAGGILCLDFWAEWCGPCKLMAPTFERVAGEMAAQAVFAKIDADKAPQAREALGVRGVPTIVVLRDGEVVGRKTGAISSQQLRALVTAASHAPAAARE